MRAHACAQCGATTTNKGRCTTCAQPYNHEHNARPTRTVYATQRWRDLRLKILTRDKWQCRYCGNKANIGAHLRPFRDATDPIAWDETNIVASCAYCNNQEAGRRATNQNSQPPHPRPPLPQPAPPDRVWVA